MFQSVEVSCDGEWDGDEEPEEEDGQDGSERYCSGCGSADEEEVE